MLKPCPECEMQVSDKAAVCPHCGFPLHSAPISTVRKSRRRHARLPNGFGQITELRGRNLRKPFRAMVTVGVNPEGKPIVKLLQPVDPRHHTHDCRKTFVTMAKRANVDEYAIKRIIGHQIADLTERVYTDRSIDWLRSEIEKIR